MKTTNQIRPPSPLTRRSSQITAGVARAPQRAMLWATGLTEEDLQRPLIGLANTWVERHAGMRASLITLGGCDKTQPTWPRLFTAACPML